jgi:cytidylate kinase
MAIITISRQFGAGGKILGKMIAKTLGYTFADDHIVEMVAEAANVSPHWVESVEKEAGSTLSRIISSMVSKRWLDRILVGERGYIDEDIYLDYIVVIISQVAEEGDVIILGRGSQYILDDHPDAHHVLLIDEVEHRVKFMMDHYDLSQKQAARVVRKEDKRRLNFYRKLGKEDFDDPALYHLVLNMSRVDLETASKLVCKLADK